MVTNNLCIKVLKLGGRIHVARSVVMRIEMQVVPRAISYSGTFFCEDSSSFAEKGSYQLIAKGCTLRNGKLHLPGLPGNSVVRITDLPKRHQLFTVK